MTMPPLRTIDPDDVPRNHLAPADDPNLHTARSILAEIDSPPPLGGDSAVLRHARRLGDLGPGDAFLIPPAGLIAARDRLPLAKRELLERAAARIQAFALAQKHCLADLAMQIPGGEAGHQCVPVRSAGCYAPGGRFPLPSSVLMTVVTARAAGVSRCWVASPRPTDATLAAAAIAGADGCLAIGGVQAIATLARGLLGVPPCDIIVGPGNRWVTAAKQLISGRVGIDMLAGPSELLVLADDTADPVLIAADLLAQAEHDDDALPMLITTSRPLIEAVNTEIQLRLATLPTSATASAALNNGFAAVAQDIEHAIALCDLIAPEHLEIMTRDAPGVSRRIANAGSIFIGPRSAEVLCDYGAGPNHVLPTAGTSRFKAGLSVFTFLRARTWMRIDDTHAARPLIADAAALARVESLEAHARAAELREESPIPESHGKPGPPLAISRSPTTFGSCFSAENATRAPEPPITHQPPAVQPIILDDPHVSP